MMPDNFAVFILSHGRANNVSTYKMIKRCGYTGKIYIVIDNEDEQESEYRELFGDKVLLFDKLAESKKFDTMDTSQDRRTIVYARNACFWLAKQVGVRYFCELDDDYRSFEYRWIENGKFKVKSIDNLDEVFAAYLDFLQVSGAVTVALAQGGDFIGGGNGGNAKKRVLRKAMNSFICDVEKPFTFIGRINEDVNTYTRLGCVGMLFFTITDCALQQARTQKNSGGMTGVYLDGGTYVKSFYTVIAMPSCVKIGAMGNKEKRFHHQVEWDYCVPKILNEKWRKER